MRIILKIFAIPFVIILTILGAVTKFFAWLSGTVFALISILFGIGGAVLLFKGDIYSGIGILILAFLVSPFGIPAIAQTIAESFERMNDSLKHFIMAR